MDTAPDRLHLDDLSAAILDFEHRWWVRSAPARPDPKEAAIRSEFGFSPMRYYQLLNNLLDCEAALARYPDGQSPARDTGGPMKTATKDES